MRPSTEFFKARVGTKPVTIAELGVADGKHAWILYNHFTIQRLFLIDSWCQHYSKNVNEWAISTFKKFDNKKDVVIIKSNSIYCADLIPDQSLDYIYIDDLHNGQHVIKEIETYLPKMKPGAVVAGHDFDPKLKGRVADGVRLYAEKNEMHLYNDKMDWWVVL